MVSKVTQRLPVLTSKLGDSLAAPAWRQRASRPARARASAAARPLRPTRRTSARPCARAAALSHGAISRRARGTCQISTRGRPRSRARACGANSVAVAVGSEVDAEGLEFETSKSPSRHPWVFLSSTIGRDPNLPMPESQPRSRMSMGYPSMTASRTFVRKAQGARRGSTGDRPRVCSARRPGRHGGAGGGTKEEARTPALEAMERYVRTKRIARTKKWPFEFPIRRELRVELSDDLGVREFGGLEDARARVLALAGVAQPARAPGLGEDRRRRRR